MPHNRAHTGHRPGPTIAALPPLGLRESIAACQPTHTSLTIGATAASHLVGTQSEADGLTASAQSRRIIPADLCFAVAPLGVHCDHAAQTLCRSFADRPVLSRRFGGSGEIVWDHTWEHGCEVWRLRGFVWSSSRGIGDRCSLMPDPSPSSVQRSLLSSLPVSKASRKTIVSSWLPRDVF